MSRHTIPNSHDPSNVLVIGWDAPLGTYYARRTHSAPDPSDDPIEVFWIGCTPSELPTIQHLTDALWEQGEVFPSIGADQLEADRLAEGTRFIGRPATGIVAAVALKTAGPEQADRIRAELERAGWTL